MSVFGIESPEINLHTYGQFIINKGGKNAQGGKESKQHWRSWTAASKSMQAEHTLTPYTKINSKWIKDLNTRHETIKLLEENTGKTFFDISCTNIFLGQSPKAIEIKAKINKWDLMKLTSCCTATGTINKMKKKKTNKTKTKNKKTAMNWEKIFASSVANKGFIYKVYEPFIQLSNKKPNNPIKKQEI